MTTRFASFIVLYMLDCKHAEKKPSPGVFSLTFVSVNYSVEEVDDVAGVVQRPPEGRYGVVELPEYGTSYHEDEVVQDGYRNQYQPLKLTQKIVTRVQEIITCSSDLINHFRYHKIYNQLWQ